MISREQNLVIRIPLKNVSNKTVILKALVYIVIHLMILLNAEDKFYNMCNKNKSEPYNNVFVVV